MKVKVNFAAGGPFLGEGVWFVGLGFGVVGGGVWLSPRPVTGGNQGSVGAATGGGLGWWWGGVVAGCGPGRTLMRLRLPDRGENHTPDRLRDRCARLREPPCPLRNTASTVRVVVLLAWSTGGRWWRFPVFPAWFDGNLLFLSDPVDILEVVEQEHRVTMGVDCGSGSAAGVGGVGGGGA